jgi:hypothetical protein
MKTLDNLQWNPSWVSHLGCIKGCLSYLGIEMTDGWLFGGTGHAFIINMPKDACPSGPTAWKTMMLFELGQNLGYEIDGMFGSKHQGDLAALQKKAWEFVRGAIDQDLPCYGWELEIPEFYVIYGYDDIGYYISGPECDEGKGPKPWKELGDTGIGIVEVYSVNPRKAADDRTIVHQALSFALEFAQGPDKWVFPECEQGLAGFDRWIADTEVGTPIRLGMAYGAAVWESCRRHGVEFLKEAKERLGDELGALFDEAIGPYEIVAKNLKKVIELYPFSLSEAPIGVDEKSHAAVKVLKDAREAEAAGLQALTKIVEALETA